MEEAPPIFMFVKVGDTFLLGEERYRCKEAKELSNSEKCELCTFRVRCTQEELDVDCIKSLREDGKSVYFEKLPDPKPFKLDKSVTEMFRILYSHFDDIKYHRDDTYMTLEAPGVTLYFHRGIFTKFIDTNTGKEYSCSYYYLKPFSSFISICDRYGKVGEIKIDKHI